MPPGKKQKPKSGQTRVTRREEAQTARAGGGDEPSTSQEREDSGDEDTGRPELSKPFTNEQDKQIVAFFCQHPCIYDMSHPDYKNKKKRSGLILQFAQSMFTSGKCVLSFIVNFAPIVFLLVINVMRMVNCETVNEVMNSLIFLSTALTSAIQSS